MASPTTLPIYGVAYDLFKEVTDSTRHMPRDFKLSLGGRIRDETLEIVTLIFRANAAMDKVPHLSELLERVDVVELLLRLARDMHFIPTKRYAAAIALTQQVGKQAGGWRKHSASSPVASPSRATCLSFIARWLGTLNQLAQPRNAEGINLGPLRSSKPYGALLKALIGWCWGASTGSFSRFHEYMVAPFVVTQEMSCDNAFIESQ